VINSHFPGRQCGAAEGALHRPGLWARYGVCRRSAGGANDEALGLTGVLFWEAGGAGVLAVALQAPGRPLDLAETGHGGVRLQLNTDNTQSATVGLSDSDRVATMASTDREAETTNDDTSSRKERKFPCEAKQGSWVTGVAINHRQAAGTDGG